MKKDEFLRIVKKRIHYVFDRSEIEKELREHIEDSIADLMEEGLSEEEAELQAVAQMGEPVELGRMLNKEHQPLLGYAAMILGVILLLLVIIYVIPIGANYVDMILPHKIENKAESYPIDIEKETLKYRLVINDLVFTEDGESILTYRMWRKYDYTRTPVMGSGIFIEDTDGESLFAGGDTSGGAVGVKGAYKFDWPEDDIIVVVFGKGSEIRIDLEEYCNE